MAVFVLLVVLSGQLDASDNRHLHVGGTRYDARRHVKL
jgi:hypothetical protein